MLTDVWTSVGVILGLAAVRVTGWVVLDPLVAIAVVHSDNRLAATITMGIFASGVAASVLLIAAHDRPFTGQISIRPDPLLQVMPEAEAGHRATDRPAP